MRNFRVILLLTIGILALSATHVALRIYGGDATRIVRRAALVAPSFDVSRIVLTRDGHRLTLARTSRWRLVEPFFGSVDEQVVMRMLDALAFTPIQDSVSDSELLRLGRTRGDLALDEPRLSVRLEEGMKSSEVSFGGLTPSREGVYASIEGVDSVFVMPTSVLASVDFPVESLRRRSLFVVGAESVESFDIRRATESRLAFVRDGDRWSVDGQQASATKVRGLLEGVLSASAIGFVWPVGATNESEIASTSLLSVYGLDPESAVTVTFKCKDGADRQASFGKAADSGLVYALIQNGGAVVTVPDSVLGLVAQDRVSFTDARLMPFEAASVRSVVLSEGGVEFALVRGENGSWRLESPISAPADAAVAERVLSNVLTLSPMDVCEKGIGVSVTTNVAPIIVSRRAVLGEFGFESLRSREILRVVPESVRRLVVARGERRPTAVVFGRERGVWNVESSEEQGNVRDRAVAAVLAVFSSLRAERVVRLKVSATELDAYGLDKPYMTVSLDLDRADSVRRNLMVGEVTEGGRFATVGSSDAVFVIPESTVSVLETSLVGE